MELIEKLKSIREIAATCTRAQMERAMHVIVGECDEAIALAGLAVTDEREAFAKIAEAEMVDAESTGDETDAAYNHACADIAAAIRANGSAQPVTFDSGNEKEF